LECERSLVGEGRLDTQDRWGFIVLSFLLLGVLTGLGALINLVARRRVFNGAAVSFWILLGCIVALYALMFTAPKPSFELGVLVGEWTATLLPALAASYFLGRRFRKKARLTRESSQPAKIS